MEFRQRILQNYLWRGLHFLTAFFVGVIVARCLGSRTNGWVLFITNNFALAITFGSLSLEVSVLYQGIKNQISKSKLALFSIVWISAITIVFYFTAHLFIVNTLFVQSKAFLNFASIAYFSGIMLSNFFTNMFLIDKEFGLPFSLTILTNLLIIVLAPNIDLFNLQLTQQEFLYFYFFGFLLQGVVLFIAYLLYTDDKKFTFPKLSELNSLFAYGLTAFVGNIAYFLMLKVDYWLLRFFNKDLSLYGNYVNASRMVQMLLMVAMIAGSSFFMNTTDPKAAQRGKELLLKLARVLTIFYVGIFIVLLIFGREIFVLIFGASFNAMYAPFIAFAPGIYFLTLINLFGAFFSGTNLISTNIVTNLIGITAVVFLNFLIMPISNSIVVSALICSAGYGIAAFYAGLQFAKKVPFSWYELLQFSVKDFDWVKKILRKSTT